MWIIWGTKVNARRIPGGLKVERTCGHCGETATFYEREVTSTFRLYFIDVLDYGHERVMACGSCGTCYATDELGVAGTTSRESREERESQSLEARAERVMGSVGGYVDRAAEAVESTVAGLFAERGASGQRAATGARISTEDEEVDPLEDPLEARFKELERKVRIRID
jgi:hypothetical protein